MSNLSEFFEKYGLILLIDIVIVVLLVGYQFLRGSLFPGVVVNGPTIFGYFIYAVEYAGLIIGGLYFLLPSDFESLDHNALGIFGLISGLTFLILDLIYAVFANLIPTDLYTILLNFAVIISLLLVSLPFSDRYLESKYPQFKSKLRGWEISAVLVIFLIVYVIGGLSGPWQNWINHMLRPALTVDSPIMPIQMIITLYLSIVLVVAAVSLFSGEAEIQKPPPPNPVPPVATNT